MHNAAEPPFVFNTCGPRLPALIGGTQELPERIWIDPFVFLSDPPRPRGRRQMLWPSEVLELLQSGLSDEELGRHPLLVMLRSHGSRGWEEATD